MRAEKIKPHRFLLNYLPLTAYCLLLFASLPLYAEGLRIKPIRTIEPGISIRQNAARYSWPSGGNGVFLPEGSFSVSDTRARPWVTTKGDYFSFSLALEARSTFSSSKARSSLYSQSDANILGANTLIERWDWTRTHTSKPSTLTQTRIERINIAFSHSNLDFTLGRQPISLGTSHFIGVLDVIAPFAPGDMDGTYKPGVDAVRVSKGIGATGEAELIMALANPSPDGAILARHRASYDGTDVEVIFGRFRKRTLAGFGWEGEIKPFSIWGEMALFERRKAHEHRWGRSSQAAFSGVAGGEYSPVSGFVVGSAFFYQDFGVREPEDLLSVAADAPFQEGWTFLASQKYLMLTLQKEFHPLVKGDMAGLFNLVDDSALWQPKVTVSINDNADMAAYGWITTGATPSINGFLISTPSEFGMLADGAGCYMRWFF
ncbi:hypothetical protein ACFL6Y_08365 [Elusimicrobiota bacterium]